MASPRPKKWWIPLALVSVLSAYVAYHASRSDGDGPRVAPAETGPRDAADTVRSMTMGEVLDMAQHARDRMARELDDYTARFVKRERQSDGSLSEETETRLKVQTRLRGDTEQAPLRVYMKFVAPESVKGREVLWGEDLYDRKMAVHEVGLMFSLKTIWLDPNGIIAMRGQRYPISEIGMVRLVEKLIERGERDRESPNVEVTITGGHRVGDVDTELIQVRHKQPTGAEDDFSLAEIAIDPERQLILSYRSFGWPEAPGESPPLLESYTFLDVQTNVGLSDDDFKTDHPDYGFPAF